MKSYTCLEQELKSRPPSFLGIGVELEIGLRIGLGIELGIELRIRIGTGKEIGIGFGSTVFHRVTFEILHLSWTRIKLETTDFLKIRDYTVLGGSQTQDYCISFLGLGFILS